MFTSIILDYRPKMVAQHCHKISCATAIDSDTSVRHRRFVTNVENKHFSTWKTVHENENYENILIFEYGICRQCFDTVGWASGRASGP